MGNIRFKLDHHQLGVAAGILREVLKSKPKGEVMAMLHSILDGLAERMEIRRISRRLEYQMVLPVHQAIALRKTLLSAMDHMVYTDQMRVELQLITTAIDQPLTSYLSIHAD